MAEETWGSGRMPPDWVSCLVVGWMVGELTFYKFFSLWALLQIVLQMVGCESVLKGYLFGLNGSGWEVSTRVKLPNKLGRRSYGV